VTGIAVLLIAGVTEAIADNIEVAAAEAIILVTDSCCNASQ
jgi:hypothetical protein